MEIDATRVYEALPSSQAPFPVVGIGASAGGLEAFTHLFEHLPATTGMAYVIIQHLDPAHASLLPSLLARMTSMPVQEGQEGMALEPDHVYVIPPHADLTLEHGTLHLLSRRPDHRPHLAIDTFFRALARDRKQYAIGVLLSGTATDGTQGLQAIKAEGGMTFAQDAHSAQYPQMPQSAIEAGCVDHILPPEEIAQALARLRFPLAPLHDVEKQAPPEVPKGPAEASSTEAEHLTTILLLLRQRTGVDFLAYKQSTLKRRILQRMAGLQITRFADYANYLREHPAEIEALYEHTLIHVTEFFRDAAAFTALTDYAFPVLLDHLAEGQTIRIWVPGCATGEEVYSLAICLQEFLEARALSPALQFFATDISSRVLEHARAGIYPSSALAGVSAARRERFFTPVDAERRSYRIDPAIRERCVFALHNLAKDPPFSRLNLVSCRNVLIYLGPALQQKVLRLLHYALKPQGWLLLGSAESVNPLSRLFTPVEKRQKLFAKKATDGSPLLPLARSGTLWSGSRAEERGPHMREETTNMGEIQQEADRLLLTHYAPASVLIDAEMEILQVRGHTSPYLELAPGTISLNLLKMARDGLRLGLRTAVYAARKDNHPVTKEDVSVTVAGSTNEVRITVLPLKGPPAGQFFLVVFEAATPPPVSLIPSSDGQTEPSHKQSLAARRMAALEQELAATRAEMQAMLEERDAANEELQTANEEIRSSNEELQSSNEELETTQEELQAANQELTTANQILSTRNEQVQAASEYAEAIVETVRDPLLVLSQDLHIERANTAFYQCFQITPPETEGRALSELSEGQWDIPPLRTLLTHLQDTNQSFRDFEVEQVFPGIGHKIMLLNARRIIRAREPAGNLLLLLAMEDVTERRALERQKDVLIALASHELKTPLTGAKLALQMLLQRLTRVGDASSVTQLRTIDASLNRLIRVIDGFLDAAALENGELSIHPAPFALADLVGEICEELGRTTTAQRILVEQGTSVEVYGDRERTGQVLSNLLSNAIKYAPATEPIRVRSMASEDLVTVCVQDRGDGIPQDQQGRIFERFSRIDASMRQHAPGVGLGLYLAAEITKRQGGRIWVESTPGEGATFCFTIPRQRSAADLPATT
jgi:two-component system CheB/CheR fusion protein